MRKEKYIGDFSYKEKLRKLKALTNLSKKCDFLPSFSSVESKNSPV